MNKFAPFTRSIRPKSQTERSNGSTQALPCLALLHKPFQVLCQFSAHEGKQTLADVLARPENSNLRCIPDLYPAGRLDFDSEGLLLLTNHGPWQARIAQPRFKMEKTYWVQVEGQVTDAALMQLKQGVELNDGPAVAVAVRHLVSAPAVSERHPPVRFRAKIPTDWLEVVIAEGRNRQVRRMTAAVGLPTLRLIRVGIGPWRLDDLAVGSGKLVHLDDAESILGSSSGR